MKFQTLAPTLLMLSVFGLAVPASSAAADQGRGQAQKADKKSAKADKKTAKAAGKADKDDRRDDERVAAGDRDGHVRVIREYASRGSLPPGLAKRESLPPGLRKQLVERGELPPGLQKRLVRVPGPLASRLPAVPRHHERYFAGDDLLVIDTRTNRIVSIIRDVWQ